MADFTRSIVSDRCRINQFLPCRGILGPPRPSELRWRGLATAPSRFIVESHAEVWLKYSSATVATVCDGVRVSKERFRHSALRGFIAQ